jgi:hypothetical protein
VFSVCGLHLGTHADWPAGVVLPSLVDGVPSYKVQQVSAKQGDPGEPSRGEASVLLSFRISSWGLMTFTSGNLLFVGRSLIAYDQPRAKNSSVSRVLHPGEVHKNRTVSVRLVLEVELAASCRT